MNAFFAENAIWVMVVALFLNATGYSIMEKYMPGTMENAREVYGKYWNFANTVGWGLVIFVAIAFPVFSGWYSIASIVSQLGIVAWGIKQQNKNKRYMAATLAAMCSKEQAKYDRHWLP